MIEEQKNEEQITEVAPTAENKIVSITEAARINNVTRQAIYVAIKLKKLKAKKESSRWTIDLADLEEYRRQKYSREKSTFDGELLFDKSKGLFSVRQAADILGVPEQKIYYGLRAGHLKGEQKGAAWVIHEDDISNYRELYLTKKRSKISQMAG